MASSKSLPPPRVITTSHSPTGASIIASDAQTTPFFPFGPANSSFNIFHTSERVPVSNTDPVPSTVTTTVPRPAPAGLVFATTDIPPGGQSPLHRTVTLDYGCVLFGEITMVLDGGEETVIKAGDILVQRGAMHKWENRGEVTCRILCVMVGSEKIVTEEGKVLEAFFPSRP